MAELIRRGMEQYVMTFPDLPENEPTWKMPVLRGSGGHLVDPASVRVEAQMMVDRFAQGG